MIRLPLSLLALVACCTFGAGCSHLDVQPAGNPNRVLTGTVSAGAGLPAGAEIVVRLIAAASPEAPRPAGADVPVMTRPTPPPTERVLGEFTQTLENGTGSPVPFRIEYFAEDALLRRGLNLEARISIGDRVRYRTVNAHIVTPGSAPHRQELELQAVQ